MSSTPPGSPWRSEAEDATRSDPALERFRFLTPARLEYREAARRFISVVCEGLATRGAIPAETGHRVVSAFLEAFNNACIHAYKNRPLGSVEVALDIGPQRLTLVVSDHGNAFVPDRVPDPDLDALPEGGMGLFIIRSFMDEVRYEHSDGRNRLVMIKSLGPAPETSPARDLSRATE